MTKKQFRQGEVIFREGDTGETLYQIIEGRVGIYLSYGEADQKLLTELPGGRFFGEMAVIESYPRSATAVAMTDTETDEITSGEISDYFKDQPDKIMEIMRGLGGRLRELTDDYDGVCDTIRLLGQEEEKSPNLLDRIKKYADVYRKSKFAGTISEETRRKQRQEAHADGYKTKVSTYSKGTIIFKEGETSDCMYDVHYGTVGIYKNYGTSEEKLLTKLFSNEFFGELGLIDDVRRSATAVVLEDDTTLETIGTSDLEELFKQNPPKFEMILEHLSNRLRHLTNEYMSACKVVYQVAESNYKGTELSDDVKKEVQAFMKRISA